MCLSVNVVNDLGGTLKVSSVLHVSKIDELEEIFKETFDRKLGGTFG